MLYHILTIQKSNMVKENHVFRTGNFYKLLAFSSMNENVLMWKYKNPRVEDVTDFHHVYHYFHQTEWKRPSSGFDQVFISTRLPE